MMEICLNSKERWHLPIVPSTMITFQFILAAVSGAMEGGPGNETSQLASSPVASAQKQDSVIASYKELIKEQVDIFKSQTNILAWSTCIVPETFNFLLF
jgi:hypothetical protein